MRHGCDTSTPGASGEERHRQLAARLRRELMMSAHEDAFASDDGAPGAAPPSAADAATMDVLSWLGDRVRAALVEAFGPEFADADPLLAPATRAEFGDYQCNVAMGLAKKVNFS